MINVFTFVLFVIACMYVPFVRTQKNTVHHMNDQRYVYSFIKRFGGNTLSHLILLKDKQVFTAQNGSVLISYRIVGNKYIVLGDPIGEEAKLTAGLDEFLTFAAKQRATVAFYQASERFMSFYYERGYRFFKLGEEAKVCLKSFSMAGKKSKNIRAIKNKFTREGYVFSVIYPPFSSELLQELKMVSDEWLGDRHEKSFSVSSFREDYISCFPVSLLRDAEGRLVAFASLPSDFQDLETISIDLMRYTNDSPSGAMDMVFISTILWAKEIGYTTCSLGMSPLSNVGTQKDDPLRERLARFAFLNGCKFYNFKGLRRFKAKFATDWTPRYLVYKKSFSLLILQLMVIVQKEPQPLKEFIVKRIFSDKKVV